MAEDKSLKVMEAKSEGVVLLESLRKGTKNTKEVIWPGSETVVALVPLNCEELQEAYAGSFKRFAELDLPITEMTADDLYAELNTQVLARAIRSKEDATKRLFPDASSLRKLITNDEREALTTEYVELNEIANPAVQDMAPERYALIEDAVKKKDATRLSAFGLNALINYLLTTDGRPSN